MCIHLDDRRGPTQSCMLFNSMLNLLNCIFAAKYLQKMKTSHIVIIFKQTTVMAYLTHPIQDITKVD